MNQTSLLGRTSNTCVFLLFGALVIESLLLYSTFAPERCLCSEYKATAKKTKNDTEAEPVLDDAVQQTMFITADSNSNSDQTSQTKAESNVMTGNLPPDSQVNISTDGPVAHFYCLCANRTECAEPCDTSITYKDPTNPYDMPGSTWTTARNGMYRMAKDRIRLAKALRKPHERYFCFMDGDLTLSNHSKEVLLDRLSQEMEWKKIIAVKCGFGKCGNSPAWNVGNFKYVYWADAMLNCFNFRSIDNYLPYLSAMDSSSWWMSQMELMWRSNMIEPFAFKVYTGDGIDIKNTRHDEYPKGQMRPAVALKNRYFAEYDAGCCPRKAGLVGKQPCTANGEIIYDTLVFNDTHLQHSWG